MCKGDIEHHSRFPLHEREALSRSVGKRRGNKKESVWEGGKKSMCGKGTMSSSLCKRRGP